MIISAMAGLVACQEYPDGYVEVESLRIENANVSLSPTGDTSTYQLEVEILPADATNRKLSYYVPSEYLQYVTVSGTGLITAVSETPTDVVVPLKVVSTTNKNAYLTVNVVVETVSVQDVSFAEEVITLSYGGEGVQLNPIISPAHAQDGRTLSYTSLNTSVVTVNASGYVTPVGAGTAYIAAVSRNTAGEEKTGYVQIKVVYGEARYRLEVSGSAPAYNQSINDHTKISFSLMVLNPYSDPNITTYWYVAGERIKENDNQLQYDHVPSVSVPTSYTVKVRVSTADSEVEFESEVITIYNPFQGFSFDILNITSARDGYQYGDVVTFSLSESIESITSYEWYLKQLGANGDGTLVATTLPASRDLTRRLNIEGDYVLTAKGINADGTVARTWEFEFGVTRFVAGDVLLINASPDNGGVPPESYDYYLTVCDSEGNALGDRTYVGSVLNGATFSLPLTEGYYKISAVGILNGTAAKVDGSDFVCETDLIRVYASDEANDTTQDDLVTDDVVSTAVRIYDVTVNGVANGSEYNATAYWRNVSGLCSYIVEITTSDGEIILMDSDGEDGACFGVNYVVIPTDYVTLDDSFALRIKQKGSRFTDYYYYGYDGDGENYFAAISRDLYAYLTPFDGVANFYTLDMNDVGAILNYIVLYRPTDVDGISASSTYIDGEECGAFTFDLYIAFDPFETAGYYPVSTDGITLDEAYYEVYTAIIGAQQAYCPSGLYKYSFALLDDGGYTVTFILPPVGSVLTTDSQNYAAGSSDNFSESPYGASNTDFAINLRPSVNVSTAEQLYYAAINGMRPNPTTDGVLNLYNKALSVVNSIIDGGMTDLEKALAFFDWLTTNVSYDTELAALSADPSGELYRYAGFGLEGVFNYRSAVCDGISKAFSLLCAIEGIATVRVTGAVNGSGHAWNKVLIGDVWYVVDATNGTLVNGGTLYANHSYFLLSDEDYAAMFNSVVEYGEFPRATVAYDYYKDYVKDGLTHYVSTAEELSALINAAPTNVAVDIKFDEEFAAGAEEISAALSSVTIDGSGLNAQLIYINDNSNRIILKLI